MKKISIFILLVTFYMLLVTCSVDAQSPTQTETPAPTKSIPTPTGKSLDQQINSLKERIASKVAQLKLVERRGILGTTVEVSNSQLTLTDTLGNTRFIDVDELTKFSSPSAKESFGISDIPKGQTLGIIGLYNKQSQRLLARFVTVTTNTKSFFGTLSDIDATEYTIKLTTLSNTSLTVDVEKTTKIKSYTNDGVVVSGFSKINGTEHAIVTGFMNTKEKNRITADRILVFSDLSASEPKDSPSSPTLTPKIIK